MGPPPPPPNNMQQFPPFNNFQNFNQPQQPPIMPNFHMNAWNSPNSLFPEKTQGNPWQMKPPQQQIRPVMRPPPPPANQQQQMFTPPPQFHPQQPHLNSFQSLPKFPADMNIGDLNKLTINEMMSQPELLKSEKDIQFLQNVHFPEKQQMFGGGPKFPSYAHLLPTSMSFYDMANQSKDFQQRWFLKLLETFGLEEAEKFMELLRQVPVMPKPPQTNHVDAIFNGLGDASKNYLHLLDIQQQQQQQQQQQVKPVSQSFNQLFQSDELDSIFKSSVQSQNSMMGGPKESSNSMYPQASTSNFSERNILNGIDFLPQFNMSTKALELDIESSVVQSPQRSVPLYMRKTQNRNFD